MSFLETADVERQLDRGAPTGRYQIDAMAEKLVPLGADRRMAEDSWWELELGTEYGPPPLDAVQKLRLIINFAAARSALGDLSLTGRNEEPPDSGRAEAKKVFEVLASIKKVAGRLPSAPLVGIPRAIAPILADSHVGKKLDDRQFERRIDDAEAAVRLAIDAVNDAVSEIDRLERNFPIPPLARSGGVNRSLERTFIRSLASLWPAISGRHAPRSKSGPFVRLAAAAWRDLAAPDYERLEDVLGALAEKLR